MPCARAASGETSDAATMAANTIWNFTLRSFPDVESPPHTSAMRALARPLRGGAVSGGDEKTLKQTITTSRRQKSPARAAPDPLWSRRAHREADVIAGFPGKPLLLLGALGLR